MAGLYEVNSFVGKFMHLWKSGYDASLHLKTRDGKATINLQLGLGQAPPPPPPPRRVPGPSRQSRTQRRALAREPAEQAKKNTEVEVAENATEEVEQIESESDDIGADAKSTEDVVEAEPTKATEDVVEDEFCPDEVYNKTAFRCFSCRMLFLPDSYLDGHEIMKYESCRSHIGVKKCEACAIVLVGLAKIRCHRQVCQHSA